MGDYVGHHDLPLHCLNDLKGSLPLLALLTCTDACTEAHDIRNQQLVHHLLQQSKGLLWLIALFTGTDQGAVGDYVGHDTLLLHCLKHLQGSLWLLALFTGADQGAVGDDIGHLVQVPFVCAVRAQQLQIIVAASLIDIPGHSRSMASQSTS